MNPIPSIDYMRILPEIVLTVVGTIVMMADPLLDDHNDRKSLGVISTLGVLGALAASIYQAAHASTQYGNAFFNMVRVDAFSIFFHIVVLLVALAAILMSFEYLSVQHLKHAEYYGLILYGAVGMALMSSAVELVLIFIALEISSISTYVLAGFRRKHAESTESSIKYFLLGSFATGFFLYGVALMFGATGSTQIDTIAASLKASTPTMAYIAVALMCVGL